MFCNFMLSYNCSPAPGLLSQKKERSWLTPGGLHSWSLQPRRTRWWWTLSLRSSCSPHFCFHSFFTLITMSFRCRPLWKFSSGSFWRSRRQMETHHRWRKSVLWCKNAPGTSQNLLCWRQEAQTSPACQLWPHQHKRHCIISSGSWQNNEIF